MADNEPAPAEEVKPVAEADALAAMASGAELDEVDPYLMEAEAKETGVDPAAAPAETAAVAVTPLPTFVPASAPVSRVASARKAQKQASSVYAQQYKSILVPLLLAVGALLILVGLMCFFCSGAPKIDPETQEVISQPLLGPQFKWFGMIAGPMGMILLIGSYLFHMELSKKTKTKK